MSESANHELGSNVRGSVVVAAAFRSGAFESIILHRSVLAHRLSLLPIQAEPALV
jgi:hypothetical protein